MRTPGMRHPVVAGVDGSLDDTQALVYAAREAMRHGCGLRLVHAYPETIPMAPMPPLLSHAALHERANQIVHEAVQSLDGLADENLPLEVVIRPGSPTRRLLDAATDARMIVLGRRARGRLERLLTGSTSTSVAAHAGCPVVTVPAEWDADTVFGLVVVGVDASPVSLEALAVAFDAASARHASLHVLHAWTASAVHIGVPLDRLVPMWDQSARVAVSEMLSGWRERFPDVSVAVQIDNQRPADALVTASETADLLVLGRHGTGMTYGLAVGSVARALQAHGRCPVVLAPSGRRRRGFGRLESAMAEDGDFTSVSQATVPPIPRRPGR